MSNYKFVQEAFYRKGDNYDFWTIIKSRNAEKYEEALNISERININKRLGNHNFFIEELIIFSDEVFFKKFIDKYKDGIKYHVRRGGKTIFELVANAYVYSVSSGARERSDLRNVADNLYSFIKVQHCQESHKKTEHINDMEKAKKIISDIQKEHGISNNELLSEFTIRNEVESLIASIEAEVAQKIARI